MNIKNQKKIIILLVVFTIIVIAFNKSYALFQTTAMSDKPVVQITTPDELPKVSDKVLVKAESKTCNPISRDTDGTIYFSGDDDCIDFNYVWYSGKLWRITAINPDGTMKMITQDTIANIYWGESGTTYKDTWIYQWLNEDFKDTLYNYQNIIVQNAKWNATQVPYEVDEETSYVPAKPPTDGTATIVEGDVGSLNTYEYYQGSKNLDVDLRLNNYLNPKYNYWWLISQSEGGSLGDYVVYFDGVNGEAYHPFSEMGVRPSVILKSDIKLSGEGTKSNPYTITIDKAPGTKGEPINTRLSGEYVKVDNKVYRIVGIEDNTTKLTSVDYVRDVSGEVLTKYFGSNESWKISVENDSDDKYWSYYLNHTWLTATLKKYITEGTYYLGRVDDYASYKNTICSESNTSETTKKCTKTTNTWTGLVGLPRVGEMFSYLYYFESRIGYINGQYIGQDYYRARPSINLKSEVKISGGSGTVDNPYTVEV